MKKVLAITLLFVALPVQGMLRSIARLSASTRSKVLLPVLKQQKRFEHKQGLNQHTHQVATDNQNIEKWRKIKSLLDMHGSRTDAIVAALKYLNHEMINTMLPVMSSTSILWSKDKDGNLPINVAIRLENDAAIDYILECGKAVVSGTFVIHRKDANSYSSILTAIECKNFKALGKILEILGYTTSGDISGALEFAVNCGNKNAAEMILKSFNWAIIGSHALDIALKREDWEMVVMLEKAGGKLF